MGTLVLKLTVSKSLEPPDIIIHKMDVPLALYPTPVYSDLLHTLESAETGSCSGVPGNFWKKFQAKPVDALVAKTCYYGKQSPKRETSPNKKPKGYGPNSTLQSLIKVLAQDFWLKTNTFGQFVTS